MVVNNIQVPFWVTTVIEANYSGYFKRDNPDPPYMVITYICMYIYIYIFFPCNPMKGCRASIMSCCTSSDHLVGGGKLCGEIPCQ